MPIYFTMNLKKLKIVTFICKLKKGLHKNMGASTEYILLGIASFKLYQPNYAQKLE